MKNKHKSKKPRSLQEKIFDVLIYGMAILLILLIIYPLWFVIIASFSNLVPTMMIMLILAVGQLLNIGFEKVLLLQNPLNLSGSEIISTYVYKVGLKSFQYSYSTAINLFQTVINLVILVTVNFIS